MTQPSPGVGSVVVAPIAAPNWSRDGTTFRLSHGNGYATRNHRVKQLIRSHFCTAGPPPRYRPFSGLRQPAQLCNCRGQIVRSRSRGRPPTDLSTPCQFSNCGSLGPGGLAGRPWVGKGCRTVQPGAMLVTQGTLSTSCDPSALCGPRLALETASDRRNHGNASTCSIDRTGPRASATHPRRAQGIRVASSSAPPLAPRRWPLPSCIREPSTWPSPTSRRRIAVRWVSWDALRALPTGSQAKVSSLMKPFDRGDVVAAVREALPSSTLQAKAEYGDAAVFWGSRDDRQTGLTLQ